MKVIGLFMHDRDKYVRGSAHPRAFATLRQAEAMFAKHWRNRPKPFAAIYRMEDWERYGYDAIPYAYMERRDDKIVRWIN